MSDLAANWSILTPQKKAIVIAAVLATVLALIFLARTASSPRMSLLYAGLDPASAGEILIALEGLDVVSDVRGDAIYVPEIKRDSVRMALAREGLPLQGQAGFELLDELNGIATTSEMFDATYWRAKEGELARTIMATPGTKSVRVHLAIPKRSSFARSGGQPSAAATITMARGRLDVRQATAIRFLIALAVPGLEAEQVAVIDALYGVVLSPGAEDVLMNLDGDVTDRARVMERNLIDLLEARVGSGNARVRIALRIDRERETISERLLDPDSRVMMSRDTNEVQESGTGAGNAVTIASNLPDGDAAANTEPSTSQRTEAAETARFDISEVHRQREKIPGAVNRIAVAVLINKLLPDVDSGEPQPVERSEEELQIIRELIMTAIGFDEARGDVVTVKSLQFFKPPETGIEVSSRGAMGFLEDNVMSILQLVIPALVVLALALFVLRPILVQQKGGGDQLLAGASTQSIPSLDMATVEQPAAAKTPVDDLIEVASARQDATTSVLKSWLDQPEAAA